MNKIVKILLIVIAVLAIAFFGLRTWTKSHSPAEIASIEQNGIEIEVNYCRPYMKGREIFGALVPFDKVWRTGANEATTINFNKDVFILGNRLSAGKYSLWSIPNPQAWTVIFNKETGQWGTNYDETEDALRIEVQPEKLSAPLEQLSINFAGTDSLINMQVGWENTQIRIPIK